MATALQVRCDFCSFGVENAVSAVVFLLNAFGQIVRVAADKTSPAQPPPRGRGQRPPEPMRRGAERTAPREFPQKPFNWYTQFLFLLQVAAIAVFSAVRQRCRNVSDTERGPHCLFRQSIKDYIGSLRHLLGFFRQRTYLTEHPCLQDPAVM